MNNKKRQIIAMGGGSFTAVPKNLALDLYVLRQARSANPRVCFVPTATGDSHTYIAKFYAAYTKLRCQPTHLSFFERTPNLREVLLAQDVIYVGGGNTKSMLAVWRDWDVPRVLRQAWNAGVVLAGVSAGAICWFEQGVTDSWDDGLYPLPCLGWLPGSCCPHYDGEAERRPAVRRLVEKRKLPATLALDDGAAAHFIGRKLLRVVSSRPNAAGYYARMAGKKFVETRLPITRLNRPRN